MKANDEKATTARIPRDGARLVSGVINALSENPQAMITLQQRAALGELVAGVSHEARNVLTAVLSFVQVGKRKVHDPVVISDLLEKSEKELLRCIDILSNVLLAAHERSEHAPAAEGYSVGANQVVETVSELVRHQLGLKRVRLELDMAPDLPRAVGKAGELEQAVLNLVINAMHATPSDTVVRITTTKDGPEHVAIRVTDAGNGIPAQLHEQIFLPFFTTKPPKEGTGIGLWVTRRIVTEFGGTLSVDSEVGHGATFEIRLPIEPTAVSPGGDY